MGSDELHVRLRFTQRFLKSLKESDGPKKKSSTRGTRQQKENKQQQQKQPILPLPSGGISSHTEENVAPAEFRAPLGTPMPSIPALLSSPSKVQSFAPPGLPAGAIPIPPASVPVPGAVPGQLRAGSPVPSSEQGRTEQKGKEMEAYRRALMDSERVGGLLLKKETDELKKVELLAEELHGKHYRPPSRAIPCGDERDACVKCYADNVKDPLKCADSVQAFVQCSRRAHQEFLRAAS